VKSLICTIFGIVGKKLEKNERRVSQRQIIRRFFMLKNRRGHMEQVGKWAVAAGGTTVSYFFGGWGAALDILPLAVILAHLTGMVTGFIEGGLNFIDR
jgi:hypothetical protein